MNEQPDIWRKRWQPVIAGGLVMGAALGVRHVQGLFLAPVTIDHGWSRETFGLALALQNRYGLKIASDSRDARRHFETVLSLAHYVEANRAPCAD